MTTFRMEYLLQDSGYFYVTSSKNPFVTILEYKYWKFDDHVRFFPMVIY